MSKVAHQTTNDYAFAIPRKRKVEMVSDARLVASDAAVNDREFPLQNSPVRLGRGLDADICISDRWVSRDHCEIIFCDDELVVRDLDSKYGTFVNGCRIIEKTLRGGDELQVGLSRFIVHMEDARNDKSINENSLALG